MLKERQLYEITAKDTSLCFDDLCATKYAMHKHTKMAPRAYGTCKSMLKHTPSSDAWANVSPKKASPFQRPMHPKGAVIKVAKSAETIMKITNESIMMVMIVVMLIRSKTRE